MGPDPVIFDTFAHPAVGHWMVRPAPVRPGVTAVSTEITALAGVELRYGEYVSEEFDLDTVFGAIDSASLEITMTGHVGKLEICISECVLRDFLNVLFGFRREIDGLGGVYDTIDSPAESSTIYIIDVADMLTGRKTLDFLLDGKGAILFEHNILIGPDSGTIRVIDAPSYTLERVVLNVEGPLPFIPVSINLDLKHNPSQVKIKEGQNHDNTKIKVAILSDSEFDAMQVDSSTVELGPSGALPTIGELKDVDTDGDIDLELQFKAPGISCGDTEVSLTGQTYAGALFAGTDRIETVGKECD
jgi:hypothetical protein